MRIELIDTFKPILCECYASDSNLTTKWHTVMGLEACIEKEFKDLKEAKVRFYKVSEGEALVGYFCKEDFEDHDFLTGFFLMPPFRSVASKAEFWSLIQSEFRKPFFCGLYDNNIPANKFIQSRGGTKFKKRLLPDGPATYFRIGA